MGTKLTSEPGKAHIMTEPSKQSLITKISEPKEYYHNWLYSVVPAFGTNKGVILLAGYCKICDTAFSVTIPWELGNGIAKPKLTHMNIPKTGCIEATKPWQ